MSLGRSADERRDLHLVVIGRPGVRRDALAWMLGAQPGLGLIATFDHVDQLDARSVEAARPDLAVLLFPNEAGLSVIAGDDLRSWAADPTEALMAVSLGSDADPEDLFTLVRLVGTSSLPLDPLGSTSDPLASLTCKETEVLGLLCLGWSGREMAEALGISQHTLRTHIGRILIKLRVHSRLEAVTVARRAGLRTARSLESA